MGKVDSGAYISHKNKCDEIWVKKVNRGKLIQSQIEDLALKHE